MDTNPQPTTVAAGDGIRRVRTALGWTQALLGAAMGGFDADSVGRWERGMRMSPVARQQYRKVLRHPDVQARLLETLQREQADRAT